MKFQMIDGMMMQVAATNKYTIKQYNWREGNSFIVDPKELKETFEKIKYDWFGGKGALRVATGVFWTAFITYIFPWLLDIAKVYCAFMVVQGFYREHQGRTGEGKTGFQALVHYGKWYLAFWLIPWAVELIDQIGQQMFNQLRSIK